MFKRWAFFCHLKAWEHSGVKWPTIFSITKYTFAWDLKSKVSYYLNDRAVGLAIIELVLANLLAQLLGLVLFQRQRDLAEVVRVQNRLIGQARLIRTALRGGMLRVCGGRRFVRPLLEIKSLVTPVQVPYTGHVCLIFLFLSFWITPFFFPSLIYSRMLQFKMRALVSLMSLYK